MRRAILPVSLTLAGFFLMGWLFWGAFEAQRQDVAVARAFLTHLAAEEHPQATALMTPALSDRVGPGGLARFFGQIEPWDHIGFSSRSSRGGGDDARITELHGTGDAASGCESGLAIRLIDGLIDAFDVTPLCPRVATDA
ncbi:MAG: hypothetical protein JKY00_06075 [Roseicyclus sp.]|nr:hypothetical protein [Roseicyclus sp.]